ncbi:uncharacterized protein M421DRAFT_415558 [Didymella exigua CBS 183.55]|uniref:DUF4211 domain-containing protein n=1 Tax=Didymella exigua CBS 183.55 TaxID=1150837 RepID=A0A6A5S6S2_9PLEO|nr:uncharacterized protein M421DRAFT_415558 [Didymella exigua CBS 183.55]KAF1933197.1 hypothetical protein M421DRAFT_415558 [Didymella exigua CBS 183.55]
MGRKRASALKRQTKISFSPAATSSPAKTTPTNAMGPTSSRAKRQSKIDLHNIAPKGTPKRVPKQTPTYDSSGDELQAEGDRSMRVGLPVRAKSNGMFGSSDVDVASEASSSEPQSEAEKPARANATRASRKRQRAESSDEDKGTVTVIQRKRARQAESDGEEEELRLPGKRRRVERRQTTPQESDEEMPTPPRSTRRRLTKRTATPEEEVEHQSPPKSTRRRARRHRALMDGEEEEEGVQEEGNGAESGNNEEHEELREELAFLQSSPLRITNDKPKNKRQEALEALKRRRAGSTQEPSSTPARKTRAVIKSDSESELEIIKEEPDSDQVGDPESALEDDEEESDRDANAHDMFQEDEDDTGFIDDDPDAIIGEPDTEQAQLPMQFSSMSRAKPKELFKYAVEWMVMKKIHPAFNSTDEIYELTFRKLGDEVKGLASSKFTSAAWTSDFTKAINARPELLITEIGGSRRDFLNDHCEACNRRNHPATFELSLTGAPYNPESLEPLEPDSDSNSDSDSSASSLSADSEANLNGEKPTYDARGERIPPESKTFTLGSTCKANAQVAHTLHHWRYHLNDWVKGYLESNGHLTPEKLVKRDKKSDRKREKEARRIVDEMENKGEIRKLHRLYKDQVQFAVEAQNEFRMGWGRR